MSTVNNQKPSTGNASQCPFKRCVSSVTQTFKGAAQRVVRSFECAATTREAMRKLGADHYCRLDQCKTTDPFDPQRHKRCVEWVNDVLSPSNGPPD